MTDGFDFSEVTTLARDLGKLSSPLVVENVKKAVEHSAARITKAWDGKLYREGHAKRTGRSISFDVGVARQFQLWQTDTNTGADPATIVAEIGPRRTGSAKLAANIEAKQRGGSTSGGVQAGVVRLLENGSANNAPHGYGAAALFENEADFDAALDFAIWAAEKEAGL